MAKNQGIRPLISSQKIELGSEKPLGETKYRFCWARVMATYLKRRSSENGKPYEFDLSTLNIRETFVGFQRTHFYQF